MLISTSLSTTFRVLVIAMVLAPQFGGTLALRSVDSGSGRLSALPSMALSGCAKHRPLMRIRGGAFIDKRTPTYWPILPADTIPEDGSIGGHYTLEEVCEKGGGDLIGELIHQSYVRPLMLCMLRPFYLFCR
jgi:hypothetical protein